MSKKALVILAEGAEEMEVVIVVDTLRRASVDVVVGGLKGEGPVKCSRGVIIHPDMSLENAIKQSPFNAIILPGGLKGAEALCESSTVGELLKQHEDGGSIVAAICAAPLAFKTHGIATGKKITSYPAFKEKLESDYDYSEDRVVVDGNFTTSRGPGTAFEFALSLAEQLTGDQSVIVKQMLL